MSTCPSSLVSGHSISRPLADEMIAPHQADDTLPQAEVAERLPRDGGLRVLAIAACPMPARRGTPVRIERLSEALIARGHEVVIATYHIGEPGGEKELPIERIGRTFKPGTLPPGPTLAKLFLYDPQLVSTVRRLLASRPFDVIHAHHFEGLLIGALARPRGMPLVYDAHTMLGSELPTYVGAGWRSPVRRVARWLDGWLPRLADHVICAGAGTRDALVDRHELATERVTVAWNGVEIEHFMPAAMARPGSPSGGRPRRILYTGTLAGYQDIDLLLRAFALLRATHPDVRLVLASRSPFDEFRPLAQSLGIADAIDLESDDFAALPAQLAGAAIAAVPRTHCDGVPQKLLNYMAAACPVVVSAGSATLLQPDVTGIVVPNGEAESFAAALRRLLDDPAAAAAMGARGHDVITAGMSWDATAAVVEQVYRDLLRVPATATAKTIL